jgi:hypothetical protein
MFLIEIFKIKEDYLFILRRNSKKINTGIVLNKSQTTIPALTAMFKNVLFQVEEFQYST